MKSIKSNLCYYILGISVLLFGMIMAALYSVPVISKGLVFSLYTLSGMILPGYALANLFNIKCTSDVELIAYIIFFGYLASFIQYFFIVPLGIQDYAFLVWIVILVSSIGYLILKKKNRGLITCEQHDKFGMRVCVVLFLIVVLIKCGVYAGTSLLPYDAVQITGIHEDLTYWIGNTVELAKRFPPYNFRHYGWPYNYHYFTSVQMAGMSLMTGVSPSLLCLCFSYIYPSAMLVFGGYASYSKCSKLNLLRLGGMVAFLFTAGFSDFTDNRYAGYIYEYPFAFDYGIAIFVFLAFLVMNEFYNEKITLKNLSIIATFFVLLCGVKANFGAIALVGMGMCSLRWFFRREQRKNAIILGGIALVVFSLVYYFVTNVQGYIGSFSVAFKNSNLLTNADGFGDGKLSMLYIEMLSLGMPSPMAAGLIVIIYTLMSNPLVFGIMSYQIVRAIIRREKLAEGSLCLLAMAAVGAFICVFIGMYGWSERYFMYNAFPVGAMFVILNWKTKLSKTVPNIVRWSIVIVLLLISVYGLIKYDGRLSLVQDTYRGYTRYFGSEYYKETRNTITQKQLEAYEWLSERAGRYDVITTNHQSIDKEIGALCQCNIIDADVEGVTVSWVVYLKEDGGDLNTYCEHELGFKKVFENDEVEIYGK